MPGLARLEWYDLTRDMLDLEGRRYTFCSEPCKWIFEHNPADDATVAESNLSPLDVLEVVYT